MSKPIAEKITDTHVYFYGGIFSQFHRCTFIETKSNHGFDLINPIEFCSAEQYMMYQKAALFQDWAVAKQILSEHDSATIKALGRQVKFYDEETWNKLRFDTVVRGNYLKFSQNQKLKEELLKLKDKTFVEASGHDKIWGVGLWPDDISILDESKWLGQNLLGKAINKALELILNDERTNNS